ncbi:hypothetical protein ACIO6T_30850 [Streptomyces sp. NPDC087532]|uniref:hypothetical protein n=1 Tax=Streptomyces sp. NPDC087532 TaxID=3365795 RepID=UPI003814B9DB
MTAVTALGAHMYAQHGNEDGIRRALGRVDSCVVQLLQGVHVLRVFIGNADEDEG